MRNKLPFLLGLIIPLLIIFRAFFLPGPLVWGDAPFFFDSGFKDLVHGPYAWVSRGNNFGGPNLFLSLFPVMAFYGLLNALLGLSNDVIIRIIFYIPSVVLAFLGSMLFAQYLKFPKLTQFFTVLVYGLNTYFILLIDGGQVGVALAYGIFPITLILLKRYVDDPSFGKFFASVFLLALTTTIDARFSAIAVITILLWIFVESIIEKKFPIKYTSNLLIVVIVVILLESYWILPMISSSSNSYSLSENSATTSLIDALFMFQPHWPFNEFGRTNPPPFYFVILPILIVANLLLNKLKRIFLFLLLFIFFVFLVKGSASPLGNWYQNLINVLPLGSGFRDATKFFAPLMLFGGILIGNSVELLMEKIKRPLVKKFILVFIYAAILLLIYPAFLGKLTGVLHQRTVTQDPQLIEKNLDNDNVFFRTVWFPERHPFSFQTEEKPALDAKLLVDQRPFASINIGTFDRFNFLHNDFSIDWLRLLGVKYLIFSGEQRKTLTESDQKDWNSLLQLVSNTRRFERLDWEINLPVFKIPNIKPKLFSADKLFIVVGGDSVYKKIKDAYPDFSIDNQPFVFTQDGKFNVRELYDIHPGISEVIFNDASNLDFYMSLLPFVFEPLSQNIVHSDWALRSSGDYLKWKYELLTQGINTQDLDFNKGIAFSSQANETLTVKLFTPNESDYMLAVRSLTRDVSDPLIVKTNSQQQIPYTKAGSFEWNVQGPIHFSAGEHQISFINKQGLHAVNLAGLIPIQEWETNKKQADNLLSISDVVHLDNQGEVKTLVQNLEQNKWQPVDYKMVNPARYSVNMLQPKPWLIFSDSYNSGWVLKKDSEKSSSYPFYSMINGFYTNGWNNFDIEYEGQSLIFVGIKISLTTLGLLVIIALWHYSKGRKHV